MAENLVEMCYVGWKAELVRDKLGYSAEISKQSVKSVAWFLLVAYVEKENNLKKELISKRKPALEDLKVLGYLR